MLINEAKWIHQVIKKIPIKKNRVVLNFGSQNVNYNKANSHILEYVINPLKNECIVKNLDVQSGINIDYSGDILNDDYYSYLLAQHFDGVLLNNVLEHVADYKELAFRVGQIIEPGGFLIFTGPYKYPLHLDPIDNGFRPNINEIADLFKGFEVIEGRIIEDFTYSYYLKNNLSLLLVTVLRVLTPFYRFNKWKNIVLPKFLWWNKNFEVTCVLLQKEKKK